MEGIMQIAALAVTAVLCAAVIRRGAPEAAWRIASAIWAGSEPGAKVRAPSAIRPMARGAWAEPPMAISEAKAPPPAA